ncbi:hypothetical protein N7G274_004305 [Stereocaulon virgatum]|uniref:Uncharacterized protein n=1 Tax=Stereocaulon virgatum TaxID=373712 RepID=A0ABR4ADP6_9LECA
MRLPASQFAFGVSLFMSTIVSATPQIPHTRNMSPILGPTSIPVPLTPLTLILTLWPAKPLRKDDILTSVALASSAADAAGVLNPVGRKGFRTTVGDLLLRVPVFARSYTWGQLNATMETVKDYMVDKGQWAVATWEVEDMAISRKVAEGHLVSQSQFVDGEARLPWT